MKTRFLSAGLATLVLCGAASAQTILFDAGGFEGYTLGNIANQNGWVVDSGSTTSFVVSSLLPAGGARSLQANGGATDWAFPVLNYTPAANEAIRIQADIARNTAATSSFAYAIDVFNTAVVRTFRFGLLNNAGVLQPFVTSRFNTTTQQFDATAAVSTVVVGGAVAADTFVSFDAFFDYNNKRVNLLINGTSVTGGFDIPFADLTATNIGDADFQVASTPGATDRGFLDNYVVSTTLIPEPGSVALLASGGAILLGAEHRRRRRRLRKSRRV